jgi:hypothetical protein
MLGNLEQQDFAYFICHFSVAIELKSSLEKTMTNAK